MGRDIVALVIKNDARAMRSSGVSVQQGDLTGWGDMLDS